MCRQQSALEQKLQLEQRNLLSTRPTDPGARMIVVSWMVEVAEEFRLQQETLHASVLLLDRFLGASAEVGGCTHMHADAHQRTDTFCLHRPVCALRDRQRGSCTSAHTKARAS